MKSTYHYDPPGGEDIRCGGTDEDSKVEPFRIKMPIYESTCLTCKRLELGVITTSCKKGSAPPT